MVRCVSAHNATRSLIHCGSAIGPPVGGALAGAGAWRWLFFLNLPLCCIALVAKYVFLQVHTPKERFTEKVKEMDWA